MLKYAAAPFEVKVHISSIFLLFMLNIQDSEQKKYFYLSIREDLILWGVPETKR